MRKGLWWIVIVALALAAGVAGAQDEQTQRLPLVGVDVLQRAEQAYGAGDFDRTVLDSSLFILMNPTYSGGYYLRGVAYLQLDDLNRAFDDLSLALEFPGLSADFSATARRLRALIFADRGDIPAALADLDAGLDAAPDDAALALTRAQLLAAEGRFEDALADYSRVIELDDTAAAAYLGRAAVQRQLNEPAAALADYTRALELDPQNVNAYVQRAAIAFEQEDYAAALADLDGAIGLSPQSPTLYLSRGAAYVALKDQAAAAQDFNQWLAIIETRRATYTGRLRPGESVVVPLEAGLVYAFPFEAAAGQTLRLSAGGRTSADVDSLLVLLDPSDTPVAADDDSGDGMNALIGEYAAPVSGVYTLLLGHAGGPADGPVRVLLQVVGG